MDSQVTSPGGRVGAGVYVAVGRGAAVGVEGPAAVDVGEGTGAYVAIGEGAAAGDGVMRRTAGGGGAGVGAGEGVGIRSAVGRGTGEGAGRRAVVGVRAGVGVVGGETAIVVVGAGAGLGLPHAIAAATQRTIRTSARYLYMIPGSMGLHTHH